MIGNLDLDNIIGNKKVISHLKSDILNNNLAHAYLFTGPYGIGKFTLAKAFATSLQNIVKQENQMIDTYIINQLPEENRQSLKDTNLELKKRKSDTISIDDIHALIHILNQTSFSNFQIAIIKDIERMNKSAANAILKTLEEPASHKTIFILTTESISKIPKTIISRCRLINFQTISPEEILSGLKNLGYKIEPIERLIEIMPPHPGRIINLIENSEDLDLYVSTLDQVKKLLESDKTMIDRFKFIEQIYTSKKKSEILIESIYYFLYNQFNSKGKSKKNAIELDSKLQKISKYRDYFKKNINPRLVLENIMLVI